MILILVKDPGIIPKSVCKNYKIKKIANYEVDADLFKIP